MIRVVAAALVCSSCGGSNGALVELTGSLPTDTDALTVTVLQTRVLESRSFLLAGKVLPQTVGLNSNGVTRGSVLVVAQASAVDRVVAAGFARVELGVMGTVKLVPVCSGAGCGCRRTNCLKVNAQCGAIDDECRGVLDCGACPSGEACAGSDAGQSCTSGACVPVGCTSSSCGLLSDGCGGVVACAPCDGG